MTEEVIAETDNRVRGGFWERYRGKTIMLTDDGGFAFVKQGGYYDEFDSLQECKQAIDKIKDVKRYKFRPLSALYLGRHAKGYEMSDMDYKPPKKVVITSFKDSYVRLGKEGEEYLTYCVEDTPHNNKILSDLKNILDAWKTMDKDFKKEFKDKAKLILPLTKKHLTKRNERVN